MNYRDRGQLIFPLENKQIILKNIQMIVAISVARNIDE